MFFQDISLAEEKTALKNIFKLPDIALPVIQEQLPHEIRIHFFNIAGKGFIIIVKVIVTEHRDILAPVTKRRNLDLHNIQPVEQILPELPRLDRLLEISVRRRNDPNINRRVLQRADPLKFPVIQEGQKFRLHRHRQFADLVQKDRTAVRQLNQALFRLERPRKRAALVAKELALHQIFRNRTAVNAYHQVILAGAVRMNLPRHNLLARSRLPAQEYIDRQIFPKHLNKMPDPGSCLTDT